MILEFLVNGFDWKRLLEHGKEDSLWFLNLKFEGERGKSSEEAEQETEMWKRAYGFVFFGAKEGNFLHFPFPHFLSSEDASSLNLGLDFVSVIY